MKVKNTLSLRACARVQSLQNLGDGKIFARSFEELGVGTLHRLSTNRMIIPRLIDANYLCQTDSSSSTSKTQALHGTV